MTTALDLRRIDADAAALRRAVTCRRADGMAIDFYDPAGGAQAIKPPRPDADYIAFQAVDANGAPAWDGLVCCDEWLAGVAPALAGLALPGGAAQTALELFAATPQPLSEALPYQSLTAGGLVAGKDLHNAPLAALRTPQATVWLRALPPQTAGEPALAAWAQDIPATLQFLLGASRISRGRLSKIEPGDVLLVTDHALRMRCNGLVLGWYSITEKGIIVDQQLNQAYEDSPEAATQAAPEEARSGVAQSGVARIPVRLEFVLQQNRVTMGELGLLHGGQVIDLAPDAEKQVLVLANGAVLGRGELVQLEDRLGVEMIDIYGESDHAD
ncbi:MAG TPA: type III secretion system cytoplasmic ring protein SctQ [Herbaspirillum sp.]|jgi:type III secretion protein Q